jgi:Xaa-Pro aminopeptidase
MKASWHQQKVTLLQEALKNQGLKGAFFFHHVDIFYLSGYNLGNFFYVPVVGTPTLFTRKGLDYIQKTLSPTKVAFFKSFKELPHLIDHQHNDRYGVIAPSTPLDTVEKLCDGLQVPLTCFENISPLLRTITPKKTAQEIESIHQAALVMSSILSNIKRRDVEQKSEIEVSAFINYQIQVNGGLLEDRFRAFNSSSHGPMVLTKENLITFSSLDITYGGKGSQDAMRIGSSQTILQEGFPFIVDTVCATEGLYCDMTRTYSIGKPSELLTQRYQDVLKILDFILSLAKPGTLCSTIYEKTLSFVEEMGYKDNFMGLIHQKAPFIGHGIGAFVDEFPVLASRIDIPLEENMVLAIEPKLYFEDFICVGIENTYVIKAQGPHSLCPLSNDLIVL